MSACQIGLRIAKVEVWCERRAKIYRIRKEDFFGTIALCKQHAAMCVRHGYELEAVRRGKRDA